MNPNPKLFKVTAPNLQPWQEAIIEDALNETPISPEMHAALTELAKNTAFQMVASFHNPESQHDPLGEFVNPPTT